MVRGSKNKTFNSEKKLQNEQEKGVDFGNFE
mgnify:CR=1 FL=1